MEETPKPKRTYTLAFTQDFGSVCFDVVIEANSLTEAIELASDPENQPEWLLDICEKANDLGIEPDRCIFMDDLTDYPTGEQEEVE